MIANQLPLKCGDYHDYSGGPNVITKFLYKLKEEAEDEVQRELLLLLRHFSHGRLSATP